MSRSVNRDIIDKWIDENGPNGMAELAVRSKVSTSTIGLARRGVVPKRGGIRTKLCRALGVSEDALFPPLAGGGEVAS